MIDNRQTAARFDEVEHIRSELTASIETAREALGHAETVLLAVHLLRLRFSQVAAAVANEDRRN